MNNNEQHSFIKEYVGARGGLKELSVDEKNALTLVAEASGAFKIMGSDRLAAGMKKMKTPVQKWFAVVVRSRVLGDPSLRGIYPTQMEAHVAAKALKNQGDGSLFAGVFVGMATIQPVDISKGKAREFGGGWDT